MQTWCNWRAPKKIHLYQTYRRIHLPYWWLITTLPLKCAAHHLPVGMARHHWELALPQDFAPLPPWHWHKSHRQFDCLVRAARTLPLRILLYIAIPYCIVNSMILYDSRSARRPSKHISLIRWSFKFKACPYGEPKAIQHPKPENSEPMPDVWKHGSANDGRNPALRSKNWEIIHVNSLAGFHPSTVSLHMP